VPTLYKTLGIKDTASPEQIKKAYRKKVKKHHPDVGGDPELFNKIQEAYDILSDPEKRKAYDTTGTITNEPNYDLQEAVSLVVDKIKMKIDSLENDILLTKGGMLLDILVSIKEEIKEKERNIEYEKERIRLLKILNKRMKTKRRNQINAAREAMDQLIDHCKNGIESCKLRIKILSKALKIAGYLTLELDIDPNGIINPSIQIEDNINSREIINYLEY
jgi:organic radical activating enzyme